MRHDAGVEGVAALAVSVEFAAGGRGEVGVRWTAATASGVRKKFECARIFLVPLEDEAERVYLGIIDGRSSASMVVPDGLRAGEYAVEVDAYESASWGDGRLDARGRSEFITIGA
ncbi:hypothetical protein [Nocardia yamanashiensis]|uniref:hypothetical protein n=1 Tax=Nocardia yamanashiensis TaxID=209247 RepID=UPI000AECD145|nr:hypothetical protein [Nocardia yamanashiensis]